MISAVIFDFDGIIVDTEPLHYKAFQEVLRPVGLGYTWEEYMRHYIGFDDRDAFREAFKQAGRQLSADELPEIIARKAAAFNRIISAGVQPYPGVVDLIASLKKVIPLALCSGALRCDIDPILDQLGLASVFDVIVTADNVAASKPDPASYLLSLRHLRERFPSHDLASDSTLAIEDTPAGIVSARGAGLHVLAVTNSYSSEKLTGATAVVDSLEMLDYSSLNVLISSPSSS